MKSVINEANQAPKSEYPCLKISNDGTIVLFTNKRMGVVLYEGERTTKGEYGIFWAEELFTPFNGTITLFND